MSRGGAITAQQALLAAGIDPDEVRRALPNIDPARTRITPASRAYRRLWAKGIVAVTAPWGISVVPEVFASLTDPDPDPDKARRHGTLIVHELAHLDQYRRIGALRHIARYTGDYLSARWHGRNHWDAYRDIRLEVEARAVAARFAPGRQSP
ncbi:MAG: hypothetical protein M3349_05830 [Actinomycetota bacterium]|nr:hypothetical protein [Actinomycetota bacterium]